MPYFNIARSFSFDPLSVFFLAVIALVSLPSAVYSTGYLKGHYSANKILYGWVLFIAFVLSMAFVVTVNNAFLFIIVWELMSVISYFLVIFDSEHERSIRAGVIYIVMTHIGTAFIISAILIMYKYAGSFDFISLKAACAAMPAKVKDLTFILLFIGFGTKAGIVPLHIWLPYAHPQAPSHVSSLMSGVMIKTAIYGIIRFAIIILGINSALWGIIVLIAASISCLVGVIYALMEHDLKKLLAYHSVENIGIILLGVGASMLFMKLNMPVIAVFAMAAGLYHLINHAIFKGLLFLCAGSVYKTTGKRDIEKLGGLIRTMPWTAAAFLIGAMAISALPPLNGFVSEWLTLQSLFMGMLSSASAGMKIFMGMLAAILALTGGLAAACFVKAFGITFLAMPRSKDAAAAREAPFSMKLAMAFLSFLAIGFGVGASFILKILIGVSSNVMSVPANPENFVINNFIVSPKQDAGIFLSTPMTALAILAFMGIAAFAFYVISGRAKVKAHKTWDCGYYKLDQRTEYTATGFSKPFRIAFDFFLLPYRKTEKIRESFYHIKSFKYETHTTYVFKRFIYEPLLSLVFRTATVLRRMQPGSIHLYISYIFITILVLIMFMNRF
jgi:hydrogenase-4 component B